MIISVVFSMWSAWIYFAGFFDSVYQKDAEAEAEAERRESGGSVPPIAHGEGEPLRR